MKRTRMKQLVAGVLTLMLMAPAGAALASSNEAGVAERTEGRRTHRQFTHPTVTIDRVYRGEIEGALQTYAWTGDIFGTGTETVVNYTVGVDDAGVPVITSVVVDESTLPEGATYTVREGSVTTRTEEDDAREEKSEDTEDKSDDSTSDDDPNAVEVSATTSTTSGAEDAEDAEDGTGDAAEDDTSDDTSDDERTITRYAGRAGVHFQLGERWAGLMILVHGALLGDGESVAYVRSILVSPPANGRDDTREEENTDEEATEPDRDKDTTDVSDDDRERHKDRRKDHDRDDKDHDDRDRGRDGRGDDDRSDRRGSDDGRGSHGGGDHRGNG